MEQDLEKIIEILGWADEAQVNPDVSQMLAQMAIARALVALCNRLDIVTTNHGYPGPESSIMVCDVDHN